MWNRLTLKCVPNFALRTFLLAVVVSLQLVAVVFGGCKLVELLRQWLLPYHVQVADVLFGGLMFIFVWGMTALVVHDVDESKNRRHWY